MPYGMSTYEDAQTLLLEMLEIETLGQAELHFYVDQILTEMYDEAGCWDIQEVPEDTRAMIIRDCQIW